jgi:hypothetical protein
VTKEDKKEHRMARHEAIGAAASMIKAAHPEFSVAQAKAAARRLVDQTLSQCQK